MKISKEDLYGWKSVSEEWRVPVGNEGERKG